MLKDLSPFSPFGKGSSLGVIWPSQRAAGAHSEIAYFWQMNTDEHYVNTRGGLVSVPFKLRTKTNSEKDDGARLPSERLKLG